MGTLSVKVTIVNPLNPDRSVTVDCLVDTGAAYSQLPRSLLASIGIEPLDLASGPLHFPPRRTGLYAV